MKKIFFALSSVVIMASCSQNSARPEAETKTITPTDTAGLAQFQAWKAQNELAVAQQQQAAQQPEPTKEVVRERVVYVKEPRRTTSPSRSNTTAKPSTGSSGSTGSAGSTGTSSEGTSEGTETAQTEKKEGWSKAAKGAVIGGAGGAAAGAIINKRNRAAGAVIGGVIGGAAGYGIGKAKDKKDGRN